MQSQAIGAGVISAQCAVCQDRYGNSSIVSVLLCGHAFHQSCLNKWLASSSSCPQCRQPVRADRHVQRVFFDYAEFSESIQRELDTEQITAEKQRLCEELRTAREDLKSAQKYAAELSNLLEKEQKDARSERSKRQQLESDFAEQRKQVVVLREFKAEAGRLRSELEQHEAMRTILKGTEGEFEDLVAQFGLRSRVDETSRSLLNWLIVLRGELSTLRSEQSRLLKDRSAEHRMREDAEELRRTNAALSERVSVLKQRIEEQKRDHHKEVERIRSVARKLIRARERKEEPESASALPPSTDNADSELPPIKVRLSTDRSCMSDAIRLCVESPAPRSLITPLASRRSTGDETASFLLEDVDDDELINSLKGSLSSKKTSNLEESVIAINRHEYESSTSRSVRGVHHTAPQASSSGYSSFLNALKRNERPDEKQKQKNVHVHVTSASTSSFHSLLKRSASRSDEQVVYDGFGNAKRTVALSRRDAPKENSADADLVILPDSPPAKKAKASALAPTKQRPADANQKTKTGKAISDKNVLLNYLTIKPK